MIKKSFILLTVFLFIFSSNTLHSQEFKGVVYYDTNANGKLDNEEQGIKDILISNGQEVIATNKEGRFRLPQLELSHFITIHLPANYSAKEFYIKSSEKIKSYDFALTSKQKKDNFSFVQISDTETYVFRDWLNNLKEYVQSEKPAFTIHTGDICYKKGLIFHSEQVTTEKLGGRMLYCIGNHDLVEGGYGEEMYEDLLGPVYYSFEEGNALFVVTPMIHGDYKPYYSKKQVYHWLKNLLEHFPKEQPKYFFNHDVLTQGDIFNYGFNKEESINLNEYNLKAWVYGHYHTNHIRKHGESGVTSISTASIAMGGIDHAPSSFRVISIDDKGDFHTQLRYTSIDNKITIVSPKRNMTFEENGELQVSVNAYHSASSTVKVRYSIRGPGHKIDWHTTKSNEDWNEMKAITDWNWIASWKIPNEAYGKKFEIIAEATLKNGNVIRTQEQFTLKTPYNKISLKGNWTNLAHNAQHTGDSSQEIKPPLSLQWMQNVGSNIFMCSPIYADGLVYIATSDDNNYKNCHIIAYNAITGKEHWRYRVESSIKNSITFSSGLIIGTDSEGITYALDGKTGKLSWKKDLNIHDMPSFISGITSEHGIVYTGWGKGLSAINAKNGTTLWENKEWHGGEGSTPTHTVGSGVLIASSHWKSLYGHDIKTGKLLWQRSDEGLRFRDGSATIVNDTLVIAANQSIFLLDPKTGKTIRQRKTGYSHGVNTTPLVTDKYIIVGTADKGVVAFDKVTLEEVWNFETGSALFYTSPYTKTNDQTVETTVILSGDTLYFGASDGYFYALNSKTGKCLWKQDFGAPIFSTVALSGDLLFVADFSGNFYAFNTSKNKTQ